MNTIEELLLQTMHPSSVPSKVAILGLVLGKSTSPQSAATLLCGAIANIVGNVPDEMWDEIIKVEFPPCSSEGCTCHTVQQEFIKQLIIVRELFEKVDAKHSHDEKGFAE